MNITIVGDQVDRLELFSQLLDEEIGWTVSAYSIEKAVSKNGRGIICQSQIALIDLAYVSESAPQFIRKFRKLYPEIAILGIHFYRNEKLIEPLVKAGLDGYIHSNSRKSVIHEAIRQLLSGNKYTHY